MPTETPTDVVNELGGFLNDANAAQAFSSTALPMLADRISGFENNETNEDPMVFIGIGSPMHPQAVTYSQWRKTEALERLAFGGFVEKFLGQQWAVYVFSGWESEYRPRLARAHGCEVSELRYPLLGDLRRIRNDIVHGHAIASAERTGRCEIIRWFGVGDEIAIKSEHIADFFVRFPYQEMMQPR